MSSRDRDTKSLQDKLKVFFKKNAPATAQSRQELAVCGELERELSAEAPLHRRLRALKELSEKVIHVRVQEGGVEKLWALTRDLLEEQNAEARHTALSFLRCVAEGQADYLQIMRTILFHYLRETHANHPAEDTQLRFKLLHTLTNTGKNINCFEEEIGPFLLEWLPQVNPPALLVDFLQLVINIVKFNATYLDEQIVHGIVDNACHLCVYCAEAGVVHTCLSLLEAVLSYSLLPRAALHTFVAALCRTVNIEHYCQNSWKLVRYVAGADLGPAALQEMLSLLRAGGADAGLLRGAVFYVYMALWSPRRVPQLRAPARAVLPAFLKALDTNHQVVTFEVVLSLQGVLERRAAHELCEPAWDVLLAIVRVVLLQDKKFDPPNKLIHSHVHALITSIEQLHEAGAYRGDVDALWDLVDCCGHERPEASTMRLVTARAASLAPAGAECVGGALALAERYVRCEPRRTVRLHTLQALRAFIKRNRYLYGEELIELVGVPVLSACALDAECALRAAAARALTELAKTSTSDACTDLIDLLEKILNRPFEMYVTDVPIPAEADISDLTAAATGLLELVRDKLLVAPASHAARCFLVLLDHLDQHYRRQTLFQHHPDIRIKIFEMLFCLRANQFNSVGLCEPNATGRLLCSPFLLAEPPAPRGSAPAPHKDLPPGTCLLPVGRAARLVSGALTREREWGVLGAVLRALPALLHARALALGRRAQDLDILASTLCSMISDRSLNFPECVRTSSGAKLLASEFHSLALPPLAAFAPYHAYLEPQTQQRIVRCLLKYGMVLRTPQPYINALTMFTLETRETMVKMLPEVLLDLSKISDTKAIASPMLEFLSTLTRLPKVFASFVEDQYMSVFAILLPYTNPSRYNHYVVSLAHHVIAAWFLKCRLSYRRNFVRFIIHGLHNYIIMPFEEQLQYKSNSFQQNEDSSNRQRSSSLGSRVSRAPLGARGASASAAFHVELTETCLDLLARYTSTPCSVKPHRSDTAEFLFNGGQSMTWLVGNKLITITTSGCLQNSIKQGLCDRCAVLCKQHADSVASPLPPLAPCDSSAYASASAASPAPAPQVQLNDSTADATAATLQAQGQTNPPEVKRYSKYSLQHSRSTDTSASSCSLSASDPLQTHSGHTSRQNSSENNKATDPLTAVLNQYSQHFEKLSKEVDTEEGSVWRAGALAAGGHCPCWCANWAEVHVRSPTGDVCWVMRVHNQMNWDHLLDCPLADVAALLAPLSAPSAPPSATSDAGSDSEARSRSNSTASRAPPADLHKSSSDTVVGCERKTQHATSHSIAQTQRLDSGGAGALSRMGTQPINIPGSPQRQSSSSTTDDDDMLLIVPESKSRHPVRRSNSSPEMSSSWKAGALPPCPAPPAAGPAPPASPAPRSPRRPRAAPELCLPDDMILLPSCEPTNPTPLAHNLHVGKKGGKKSDMRVSCEAIPEEMCGTSPHAPHHPHLMTYNSDPEIKGGHDVCAGSAADAPPAPQASQHHQLQKTASDGTVAARDELPPLARSKRSNTISVMSPARRHSASAGRAGGAGAGAVGGGGGGVTPSFVFLQLYHNMSTYPITPPVPGEAPAALNPLSERPLRVSGAQHERTVKNLDLVPPVETYKIGVLYVGPGQQDNEVLILKNEYGSVRYLDFLRQLGTMVSLDGSDEEQPHLFLNLEKGGKDGRYTYVWNDDIMQVLFHVATAMPNSAKDPTCNEKRKYIGNDYVSIVYNDSGADFNILTIKGQLNFCIVVVEPCSHGMNRVFVKTKDERIRTKFLAHLDTNIVSDHNVALLARQMALHCALASHISQSLKLGGAPYASNSLERLRLIKRLRVRTQAERAARLAAREPYAPPCPRAAHAAIDDFNDYT